MIGMEGIPGVLGKTAYDASHAKIGQVNHVYVDEDTGQPEWMTVRTGLFGTRETFVPLEPVQVHGDEVLIPFQKQQVNGAPNVDVGANGYLAPPDEVRVYEYYGMRRPTAAPPSRAPARGRAETADAGMIRSEERLHVGKETVESGRAHLRKYVDTEEQRRTVPLRKENVRLQREAVTDAERSRGMPELGISEAEQEVVRQEERPVVAKETVPVERVRLAKDATTEDQTIVEKVRKERIEADGLQEDQGR
jgi:uncharacterized protein (TIGR02271 family)